MDWRGLQAGPVTIRAVSEQPRERFLELLRGPCRDPKLEEESGGSRPCPLNHPRDTCLGEGSRPVAPTWTWTSWEQDRLFGEQPLRRQEVCRMQLLPQPPECPESWALHPKEWPEEQTSSVKQDTSFWEEPPTSRQKPSPLVLWLNRPFRQEDRLPHQASPAPLKD